MVKCAVGTAGGVDMAAASFFDMDCQLYVADQKIQCKRIEAEHEQVHLRIAEQGNAGPVIGVMETGRHHKISVEDSWIRGWFGGESWSAT